MIFKSVVDIKNKNDKSQISELIQVYVRLVEVFCQKNNLPLQENANVNFLPEMIDVGIINSNDEIDYLKDFLGNKYDAFETSVKTAVVYKDQIGDLLNKLSNKKRKKLQEISMTDHRYTLVDFFCGAGGLSLGFLQEGFNVKLANDIEDVCIHTYRYNHPELPSSKLIQGDIKDIVDNIESYIDESIDIVVGGPPCQGFSEANRQRVIDDPRNKLYKYFVKAVEKISPKFVVMENVKGMLKVAEQVVEDYGNLSVNVNGKECKYLVSYRILNSVNFSVAQSRERLIYIGIRSDVATEKNITPEGVLDEIISSSSNNSVYTLADALADIKVLECPREKNTTELDSEITGKKIDVNDFASNDNAYLKLINCNRYIPFTFNHKARYCNDINYEIYRRMLPGDIATDEKIKDIMPYAHRNHCFKDKYFKLIPDKPCRTITAHLKMDCHSHIHPSQVRSLTPREAARVQSFPDDYLFLGAYLKTYMQIGNAVPVMMARGIARIVKKYL